ncbi:MAG: HDOD domain-containing protein [Phycisphaerae bacterium]
MLRKFLNMFRGSESEPQADMLSPDDSLPAEAAPPTDHAEEALSVAPDPIEAATVLAEVAPEEPQAVNAWWLPRGDAVITPTSATTRLRPVDSAIYSDLSRVLDDPNVELPQLPIVAQQVLAILQSEDADFAKAAAIAERDPVLTAEILRVVNSVSFRAVNEVQRLSQAFPRLGVRRLRAILVSATMKSLTIQTSDRGRSLGQELWQCASASGVIAMETAKRVKVPADEAYLAGLLHDIGMMVLLKVLFDYQNKTQKKITRNVFDALSERWHEHLGMRLADSWGLPDPLPELIGNHHRPPAEGDALAMHRLVLNFSDIACSMLGFRQYVPYDFFNLPCVMRLGFENNPQTREFLATLPDLIRERRPGHDATG